VKSALSKLALAWLERGRRKRFAGDLFQRFEGLEPVFLRSPGATVLDIGACDGLVAYELARRGAAVVHGFELDEGDVAFARRLFRDVPAESAFVATDLTQDPASFRTRHADVLLESYDIVLFLGVYHHLERQTSAEALDGFVRVLAGMARSLFAVRTKQLDRVEPLLLEAGFTCTSEHAERDDVGPLRIYQRAA